MASGIEAHADGRHEVLFSLTNIPFSILENGFIITSMLGLLDDLN